MKNYDQSVEINHNPNWPYIPLLLNLIKHQRPDIDQIYSYVQDPFKSKYQLLINGREKIRIENLKNPKAFIDYSQTIDDVYENLKEFIYEFIIKQRKREC